MTKLLCLLLAMVACAARAANPSFSDFSTFWYNTAGNSVNARNTATTNGAQTFFGNQYFNDNVGIGTTTPAVKLDVVGDGRVSGKITVSSPGSSFATGPNAGDAALSIFPSTHATSRRAGLNLGSWIILQDINQSGLLDWSLYGGSTPGLALNVKTDKTFWALGNAQIDGTVGIGYPAPSAKLHVLGTAGTNFSSAVAKFYVNSAEGIWMNYSNGIGYIGAVNEAVAHKALSLTPYGGLGVGIGLGADVAPTAALDVNGTTRLRGFATIDTVTGGDLVGASAGPLAKITVGSGLTLAGGVLTATGVGGGSSNLVVNFATTNSNTGLTNAIVSIVSKYHPVTNAVMGVFGSQLCGWKCNGGGYNDQTIFIPGVADGDPVSMGIETTGVQNFCSFFAWANGPGAVNVRMYNHSQDTNNVAEVTNKLVKVYVWK
jgi:hypothetical protein